jgi:fructose-specific phosphotransferase system IIA component
VEIRDFLDAKAVKPRLESKTKDEVLGELTDLLEKTGKVTDREEFLRVIREREELGSTGIGYNIAIPHARSTGIKALTGAFAISKEGIDFDALDKEPVYLFFVLAAPKNAAGDYLKALATISRLLRNRKSRQALMKASTVQEILKIIQEQEA